MRKSKDFQKTVIQMRKKGFYTPKKQRKIDWSTYTLNQINDLIDTLHFIRDEVDKVHTPTKHNRVGRPPTDPGTLAKAILFLEMMSITERKGQGWIKILGPHLGIFENIDDRVLGKAYKNKEVISILEKVFQNNKTNDGKMSGDGTGLEGSRKENYETTKKKQKNYMTSIIDSREIVQQFDLGNKQECQAMHALVEYIGTELKETLLEEIKELQIALDAGFVDRKLAQIIRNSGIIPYIFPKKNNHIRAKGYPSWSKMCKKIMGDVQAWLKEYHIRSHTESFHSSFKRIFGIITKRKTLSTYTQVLCRIIHNNRRKTKYYNMINN